MGGGVLNFCFFAFDGKFQSISLRGRTKKSAFVRNPKFSPRG
jgi:hypothetical protein